MCWDGIHDWVFPVPMIFVVEPYLTDQVPLRGPPPSGSVAVPWSTTTSFGSSISPSLGLRIVTSGGECTGGLSTCTWMLYDVHAPKASIAVSVTCRATLWPEKVIVGEQPVVVAPPRTVHVSAVQGRPPGSLGSSARPSSLNGWPEYTCAFCAGLVISALGRSFIASTSILS